MRLISMFIFHRRKREICRSFQRFLFPKRVFLSVLRGYSGHDLVASTSEERSAYSTTCQDSNSCIISVSSDDKEAARRIRLVLSRSSHGTIEDVIERLELDKSCSKIQISSSLVESLLSGFRDDWKSALGFFRWACSCSTYKHTSTSYTRMVDLLGKMKQFGRMLELVNEMHMEGFLTLDTLAKVMRRFTGASKKEQAIKIFDELELYGITKNTEAMNILLDTLSKERYVETAREIFLELKPVIPPNAYTFNIFIHGWCKINRMDEAEWTVLEMKGYGFQPSVITYSTMIEAYCKKTTIDRAYELLDMMIAEGCTPNVVTYTVIMHLLAKSHRYDAALNVVDRMNVTGCKPDRIFFNSLIYVLGKAGRLTEAIRVFERDMDQNGVTPDLTTYNTVISIFCHHSLVEEALKILEKMENASCIPDLLSFTPLLKLCIKRGEIEDMLSFLINEMVNKHQLSLDLATFSLLIHGLCKNGRLDWAFLLFEEMVNQEIVPRNQTWKLLLKEAEEKSMSSTVEKIKDLVKKCRNVASS